MKRIFAWVLLLVMVLGVFAGCKKTETVEPTGGDYISAEAAMEYLKALYKTPDEALKTPRDYERYGVIRVGGEPFTVVWTVEGADELVKVVTDDSEIVMIDVDETCQEDTPYTLTATITDQGGNTVSYTWNCILPKALDVEKVLKEAYALADGETLPYEVTLTGKVTEIVKMYDAEYKNITVTMVVEGFEEYPIECYRLKGEGVETLQIGNIITVTGTIKNYQGKIEFDQGCILEKVEKGDAVDAPTDPLEIVAAAYALKDGQSLPYVATLTGKVIDIESPYDPDYGNITVAIEVEGAKGKPIVCYRLKGTGVDQIAIDDTITVKGIIKNYKGKIEFDSGCMMIDRVSGGRVAEKPSSDPKKIMADAAKLGWGQHLNYYATLTGKVIDVESPYDQAYKNITVVISVEGYGHMPITCYRLKGNGVEKIARGDIITVKGIIENYKGKLEFGSGCTLLDRLSGGGVAKPETAHTATIMADAAKLQDGQHLDYYSSLTGVVTEIESPYDKAYGNITVIMTVAGYEGRPITCYRLKSGAYDVSKIAVGDTITVRGVLENYKGKLEYGSGCTLSYRKSGGGVAKPESSNAASILADALALEDGQKLDYYANLTGKVTEIDSPYDKNYGNISVIMEVENPVAATRSEGGNVISMLCYRLKSGAYDASKIAVGDTITVRGVIENYKGEIQFGSGSTLSKRVSGGGVAKPESSDEAAIMADALALAEGGKLDYYANLTGEVTTIKTWFDPNYGNVSLDIKLSDGTVLYCYRMKSGKADASEVRVGDTITVRGVIENYKGEVQMGAGCTVEKLVKGQNPGDSMTTQEILDAAFALASGESLEGAYELTGVITSVDTPFSSQYGNITVTMDVEGKAIQCFRLATGSADVSNLKVGDTITVYGSIINYNGKVQFNQGCVLLACVPGEGGGSDVEIPDGSVKIEFIDAANRTAYSATQQVWEQNGITVTNDKAASTNDVNQAVNPARFYKSSKLTVEYPGMTRLIFTHSAPLGTSEYVNGLTKALEGRDDVVVTRNDLTVVVDLKEPADSFVVEALAFQIRLYDITVCTGTTPPEGGETPDTPDTPVEGVATVVIYNPSSGKALSSQPCQAGSFYLGGVDVTADGSTLTGFGATEQWVLLDNGDGTYSFNYGGKNLAMGATYGSTPLGEVNDKWTVTDAGDGLYYIENVVRAGFRLEWFADKNNFSTYNYSNDGDLFKFVFYVIDGTLPEFGQGGSDTPDTPPASDSDFVDAPVADTAYKFGVNLPPLDNQNYYVDGTNDEKYLNTTTDVQSAADVYYMSNGSGYSLYTIKDGTMYFIDILPRETDSTKVRVVYKTAGAQNPTIYQFNTEYKYITTTVNGVEYTLGTYTNSNDGVTYTTLSASKSSFLSDASVIGVSQFPAWFMNDSGNEGGNQGGTDTPVEPASSANISFADKANRTDYSVELQVWQQNGITVTNEKGASKSDVGDYANPARFYQDSKLTIEYPGMTRIVFNVAFDDRIKGLVDSFAGRTDVIVSQDGLLVTVDLAEAADALVIEQIALQTRIKDITVYTGTTPPAGGDTPGGDDTEDETTGNVPVDDPVVGEAYKWAIDQKGKGVTLYFAGEMDGHYGKTTENIAEAVDVMLESADNGYYLTFKDASGAKKYITIVLKNDGERTFRNLIISDTADNVYTYNEEYKTLTTVISNGDECYFGTYGTYVTFSVSTIDKISTSYPSYFCVPGEGGETPDAPPAGGNVTLQNGDQVVIYAPAYNKALSTTKTGNYNVGVDITVADGVVSGYGDSETFTVIANADGSYSFANGGKNLSINTGYSSLGLGGADDAWKLISLGNGLYNVQNVTRSNYLEWYNQFSNWSTYGASNAATDDQFQLSFYVVGKGVAGDGGNQGGTTTPDQPVTPPVSGNATLANGDQVVIYAPAYNKALSTTKTGNYNVGVDITVTDGVVSGYGDSETFTVIANADGSYSFANGGKNLSINTGYSSLGLGGSDDAWKLISLGNGLYNVQNVTRSNYLEWYNQFSNWSTYGASNAATDDQFQLSFYVVGKGIAGDGGNDTGDDSGNQGGTTTPDNPVVPDAPSGAGTFKKVTSLAEIMAGGEFIIGAYSNGKYYFMGDALTVNRVDHVTGIAVANDQISGTDLPVWVVAKQGNGISLFSGSYLKYSGSSTALAVDTAAYEWIIAEKDNTDTFSLVASADSSRWLAHRLSYNRFAGYKESSNNADTDYCFYLVFFKKAA